MVSDVLEVAIQDGAVGDDDDRVISL